MGSLNFVRLEVIDCAVRGKLGPNYHPRTDGLVIEIVSGFGLGVRGNGRFVLVQLMISGHRTKVFWMRGLSIWELGVRND